MLDISSKELEHCRRDLGALRRLLAVPDGRVAGRLLVVGPVRRAYRDLAGAAPDLAAQYLRLYGLLGELPFHFGQLMAQLLSSLLQLNYPAGVVGLAG
jgi:hypothetical protein